MGVADLLTLLGVVIAATTSILVALINLRQNRTLKSNASKIDEVHLLVNDRMDQALATIARLEGLLHNLDPELPLHP